MLKRSQFKSEEAFIKVDFTSSLGHVGVPEDFGAQNSEEVVRVSTVVQNVRDDFHLRGRVSTVLNCACDRCLDEFPFQSRGEFEIWLATREDLVPMIDGPDDTRADEAVEKVTDDILAVDLTPHVYDAIMLSVPIKKLCREDCPGLWDRVDPEPEFEVPVPIESTDSPQEQLRKLKEALERGKKKKGRF
ncbi:hypothetical protein FVE85_3190 [Porphyridium purpureum]|uniref:DUF177 domain-containing protein n=1 Tax=Porphyridium purpureum TaxID=35688 RepID=A0A5J4YTW7_PORPP|nr:hypothetical protein FVE85_3190 [Porphyridium purpureum]|eukprot:POR1191..scf227_4